MLHIVAKNKTKKKTNEDSYVHVQQHLAGTFTEKVQAIQA